MDAPTAALVAFLQRRPTGFTVLIVVALVTGYIATTIAGNASLSAAHPLLIAGGLLLLALVTAAAVFLEAKKPVPLPSPPALPPVPRSTRPAMIYMRSAHAHPAARTPHVRH